MNRTYVNPAWRFGATGLGGIESKGIMLKLKLFARTVGLHPLTALGLLVVDWMLFGGEVATGGVGWLVSLPVGMVLGLVAYLIQRRSYNDEPGPAALKALLVGLLTAIPAPLSSFGILPLAAFGAIRVLTRDPGIPADKSGELEAENQPHFAALSE
jgi:hypothetical protein